MLEAIRVCWTRPRRPGWPCSSWRSGSRGGPRGHEPVLAGAVRSSLNVEGAFQHVLTDLFAFIAMAIAGAVACSPISRARMASRHWSWPR